MKRRATSLVVAGGAGTRLPGATPKGLRALGGAPLYFHSLRVFDRAPSVGGHVLVVPEANVASVASEAAMRIDKPLLVIAGGPERQDSVRFGLEAIASGRVPGVGRDHLAAPPPVPPGGPGEKDAGGAARLIAVHDAARPFIDVDLIERAIAAAALSGAAVPAVPVLDTIRELDTATGASRRLDRERLRLAQTPQVARLDWLLAGHTEAQRAGVRVTDEGAALELAGRAFTFVEGSPSNVKITTPGEFALAELAVAGAASAREVRIGLGEDRHPRSPERPFILAGVTLDGANGPSGHSDGDPLCHALVDAVLGALAQGSIGEHFPDTEPRWQGAAGLTLLAEAVRLVRANGWQVVNADCVLVADSPRLAPHAPLIRQRLAERLGVTADRVSVKGKRAEGLGFEAGEQGVSCRAIVLLERSGAR